MASWLIPCSPNIYDAESAFREYGSIIWHQQYNMAIGDIAYVYVTSPIKAIRCKCIVNAINIPADIGEDDGYVHDETFCAKHYPRYMELSLVENLDSIALGFNFLRANGLNGTIRSQQKANPKLAAYIENSISKQ